MATIIALTISLIAAAGALILHDHEVRSRTVKPDLAHSLLRPSRLPSGIRVFRLRRPRYGSRK